LLEFVAIGPEPGQRWRRPIPSGEVIRLGRIPNRGWEVPWDLRISREQADLVLEGNRLRVRCLDEARNPAYFSGATLREFTIGLGEEFRIGTTIFRLEQSSGHAPDRSPSSYPPAQPATGFQPAAGFHPADQTSRDLGDAARNVIEVTSLRKEIAALREQWEADAEKLHSQVKALQTQAKQESQSRQHAEEQAEREQQTARRLKGELEDVRQEVERLKSRRAAEERALRDAEEAAQRHGETAARFKAEKEAQEGELMALRFQVDSQAGELFEAEKAARREAERAAEAKTEAEALQVDFEALKERADASDAAVRKAKLDARHKAEEAQQYKRELEALQAEVDQLGSQVQSKSAALRKAELLARHKAEEAARYRDENIARQAEVRALKSQVDSKSFSQMSADAFFRAENSQPPESAPAAPHAAPADAAKNIGHYQIIEPIGQGGMGTVYKALHTRLDKIVALKVMTEGRLQTAEKIARFDREMKAIGRLDHANLVRALDAGEHEHCLFLVMEFVEGLDIAQLVERIGPLPVAESCEIMRQAAVALEYVHRQNLVHRDIKPSNLMVTPAGQIKILDLGLALLNDLQGEGLTLSGQLMGTLDYMAPEQAGSSHHVDYRADIYSLGCTFYQMLSGKVPFGNDRFLTAVNKIMAHAREPLPSLAADRPDLPPELVELLQQMTAKSPDKRPASMQHVADQLAPLSSATALAVLVTSAGVADLAPGRTMLTQHYGFGMTSLQVADEVDTATAKSPSHGTHVDQPCDGP
jgi:tRNA A-37 threonylcarbamoyl transferase component Bud32